MRGQTPAAFLKDALKASRDFFNGHGLKQLAGALPPAKLDAAGKQLIEKARADGFEAGFVFPPAPTMSAALEDMIRELATAPAAGVPDAQQYSEPWRPTAELLRTVESRGRPAGAYLLMHRPGRFPAETFGQTTTALDKQFAGRSWAGLTLPEYLVLQRRSCEEHGDHRFDDYLAEGERCQWMWLLDARVGDKVTMAYWNGGKNRVEVGWCKPTAKNKRKGAHPTVVVPLAG